MKINHDNIKRKAYPGIILLAILIISILGSTTVQATQYYVWGRVFSAGIIPEGEEAPPNPLSGVTSDHIIGSNMYANAVRNLVKVKVVAAQTGNELGSSIVTYDGGYLVSFSDPADPSIDIKFIVEELATSKILMEGKEITLSKWPATNIYYLLIPESITDIDSDREFATCPVPGKYTAIFTRVGKIEVATEVGGSTQFLISPTTGLVNVPQKVAGDLGIHPYQDAPLGGNLYMFGAFSQKLYSMSGIYYRIKIEECNDDFSTTLSTQYMSDPLVKTKYTVNLSTLTVNTDRVTLGPKTVGTTDNCYELTPLSSGSGSIQEFWSFPDLLALWRTGARSGNYRVSIELIGLVPSTDYHPITNYSNLQIKLDNIRPVAQIQPFVSPPSPAGSSPDTLMEYDSPYLYTPGPAVPAIYNLISTMLGAETDYGPGVNPICAIMDFTTATQHLAFKLTAYHANGYMRHWYFTFKRNNTGYSNIIGKYYDKTVSTTDLQDYSGLKITTCTRSETEGFQDKYIYLNPTHLDLGLSDGCGYRFVIKAATRTTDGYNYLYWSSDEDIHYLKR